MLETHFTLDPTEYPFKHVLDLDVEKRLPLLDHSKLNIKIAFIPNRLAIFRSLEPSAKMPINRGGIKKIRNTGLDLEIKENDIISKGGKRIHQADVSRSNLNKKIMHGR